MRRWFLAALLCLATVPVPALAASMLGSPGGGTPAAPSYQGPCDVITGGCAEAYSVTRDMTSAYSGPLFTLTRFSDFTTLNVGTTNHVVDTSGIAAFCQNTRCLYKNVYGQINGNTWHAPIRSVESGATPTYCVSADSCDPIWWIDPETGLPAIRTQYPLGFIGPHLSTGIPGGTAPLSLMMDGRNDAFTNCCGQFTVGHDATHPDIIGTIFGMQYSYGMNGTFIKCALNYSFCSGGEYEEQHDYADYGVGVSALGDQIQMISWDGASATNTVIDYMNGVVVASWSPPSANCGAPLPACKFGGSVGNGINLTNGTETTIGFGGDNSHADAIFREGLITNGVISPTDEAVARSNMTTFYGAHGPNTCQGVSDMSYFFGANFGDNILSSTTMAYALHKTRASQTGPIVDLRDVVTNTVNTYGPASSGCGIDPAAATFCATNGCSVATLYNQSLYATSGSCSPCNAYDTILSMTAASTAAQPTVTFGSLNGQPTMHFTGTQMLCTSTLPTVTIAEPPIGWSAVARHTVSSGTGSVASQTFTSSGAITSIGWGSAANTFNYSVVSTTGPQLTGTASDGHWHQIGWESTTPAFPTPIGTQANSYVDGSTIASAVTVGASGDSISTGQICLGGVSGSPNFSGDVAEFVISVPQGPGIADGVFDGTARNFSSLESAIFGFDQTAWGTLPN